MRRINTVYGISDVVLIRWKNEWNPESGFEMFCGGSRFYVPPSNKYDMWIWVDSKAHNPRLRGRIELLKA